MKIEKQKEEDSLTELDIFKIVRDRMYSALNSYFIWKIMNQLMNINGETGKNGAQENLDLVINKYKYFFQEIIISSYKTFILDLSVFFDSDKYDETFSLNKLINLIQKEDNGLNIEEIKKEIEKIKKPHGKLIGLILKLRNQDAAHQGINPSQHKLVYSEVEDLFKAVHSILNKLTLYYDNSVTSWGHVEKDMKHDIDLIFNNLKRGELLRLKEIREKWGLDITS